MKKRKSWQKYQISILRNSMLTNTINQQWKVRTGKKHTYIFYTCKNIQWVTHQTIIFWVNCICKIQHKDISGIWNDSEWAEFRFPAINNSRIHYGQQIGTVRWRSDGSKSKFPFWFRFAEVEMWATRSSSNGSDWLAVVNA